jgi:hypothetical protein
MVVPLFIDMLIPPSSPGVGNLVERKHAHETMKILPEESDGGGMIIGWVALRRGNNGCKAHALV